MRASKATVQAQNQAGFNLAEGVEKLQKLQQKLGDSQYSALHKILYLRAMRHGEQPRGQTWVRSVLSLWQVCGVLALNTH